MRILHLEASPGWGGQEMRIVKEALGMRERNHELFFIVQKGALLTKRLQVEGFWVKELSFEKRWWFSTFFLLLYWMKKWKIDLVNTHSSLDSWIGGLAARALFLPIVRTRHLSTRIRGGLNSFFLYNLLTDFVVTTCHKMVEILAKQSKKPLCHFQSIPTGISLEKIKVKKEEIKAFKEGFSGKFLVGTACFMRSWKGIDDFLEAAYLLKEEKIHFLIIGGGHEEVYRKKAEGFQNVTFTGHLENPFPAIASLDVFLLLSTAHEGVSQASLQAAFLERPLITTDTGGLPEVCLSDKTGIIVPKFSPLKVKEAILKLKASPSLCKLYGKNARALVLEKFTENRMLDEMEGVYKALEKKPISLL